jgi:hypothetical protein
MQLYTKLNCTEYTVALPLDSTRASYLSISTLDLVSSAKITGRGVCVCVTSPIMASVINWRHNLLCSDDVLQAAAPLARALEGSGAPAQ